MSRPSAQRIEDYRAERSGIAPTATPADEPPRGFRHATYRRVIGSGQESFDRARTGLAQWASHRGSGVEVFPTTATLEPGSTVALVMRQLGLWVLAACRVETVIDEPTEFGFVYATLPGHPECGYESFVVDLHDGQVTFQIDAVSKPGIALVRLGAPVTRLLQRRATKAYLTAMETWVRNGSHQT